MFPIRKFSGRSSKPAPKLPAGIRIYAVGDVHGRVDLVNDVLSRIKEDLAASPISRPIQIFLGDYVDRGPESRAVIDRFVTRLLFTETVFLKGNHETFVTTFLETPAALSEWRRYGGLETLQSYGLQPSLNPTDLEKEELAAAFRKVLPSSHRRFLNNLRTSFSCGDFFFVHAGIRPGVPLPDQREDDLLWIREEFLVCEQNFGKVIVHGHTPVREPDVRANRINIDTGAYATGRLTCIRIEGNAISFI